MPPRSRTGARWALPIALIALLGPAAAPGHTPDADAPGGPAGLQQESDTLVGTIRTVDSDAGVEIITGFHLALSVTYVLVDAGTRISVGGRDAGIGDLRPGAVVRVR